MTDVKQSNRYVDSMQHIVFPEGTELLLALNFNNHYIKPTQLWQSYLYCKKKWIAFSVSRFVQCSLMHNAPFTDSFFYRSSTISPSKPAKHNTYWYLRVPSIHLLWKLSSFDVNAPRPPPPKIIAYLSLTSEMFVASPHLSKNPYLFLTRCFQTVNNSWCLFVTCSL